VLKGPEARFHAAIASRLSVVPISAWKIRYVDLATQRFTEDRVAVERSA